MLLQSAKQIGADASAIGLAGAGIGIIFGALITGTARNPNLRDKWFQLVISAFALAEYTELFAFLVNQMIRYIWFYTYNPLA